MKVDIVIGLGFGDEGKGLTTDFLLSQNLNKNQIVMRFSGGQQAGHTVIHNGIKHIHSSYGSGTLRGIPTYFTEHCTVSINHMANERDVLREKIDKIPDVYVHPLAMLTTPFDVAFNRVNDMNLKHGSCGMGVGATMNRNNTSGHKLYAIDLIYNKVLFAKLAEIDLYYRRKIDKFDCGATQKAALLSTYLKVAKEQADRFAEVLDDLPFSVSSYDIFDGMLNTINHIVMEGSQGILLDMDHGVFPNVTYANTTSKNALEVCKKLRISSVQTTINYVTRCYQTRHGNGWMSDTAPIHLVNNEEEINVTNKYQGAFKVKELDYDLLNFSLYTDNIYAEMIPHKNLIVTCMDQRDETQFQRELLPHFEKVFYSYSPNSKDIQKIK